MITFNFYIFNEKKNLKILKKYDKNGFFFSVQIIHS